MMSPFTKPARVSAARTTPASRIDWPKSAFSIKEAASTLATAMSEPTERSIPAANTTAASATAANAAGRTPSARERRS